MTDEAKRGYEDYHKGVKFNECPWQGLTQSDIDKRWNWQCGWLHALNEKER